MLPIGRRVRCSYVERYIAHKLSGEPLVLMGKSRILRMDGRKRFSQIFATMWRFSGRFFMLLSFPVFFEFEFLLLTFSFLCYLFRFSLKIIVNLLGS